MTPEQIELVQRSFARVVPVADEVASDFYDRLFETAPEIRHFFHENLEKDGVQLMSLVADIVVHLDHAENYANAINKLSSRQSGHDVAEEMYAPVGAALVWSLAHHLGEDFTTELQEAWLAALKRLFTTMREVAPDAASDIEDEDGADEAATATG